MVQLKTTTLVFLLLFGLGNSFVKAQDFWEPITNITGYISTEFNYFDNLDGYEVNYGTAVSEAGLLITYQPTSTLTLKSVFVYRPEFEFDQMLNEAFGQLALSNELNFKVGRFLLPLSPMNTYYYAPVNTSATLPILITNHEFFPLNIDGVSINGDFGDEIKVRYDLFAGGYRNTTWLPTGAVGFFGGEVPYFKDQINSPYSIDRSYNNTYNTAWGGHIGVQYKSLIDLGASYFNPKKETLPVSVIIPADALFPGFPFTEDIIPTGFQRPTYGFNAKLHYENTKVVGELWRGNVELDPLVYEFQGNSVPLSPGGDIDLEGSFVEVSHRINKFTPYARYEDQLTDDIEYSRWTFGINYKPSFERTVKLEYLMYDHSSGSVQGAVATLIYSF